MCLLNTVVYDYCPTVDVIPKKVVKIRSEIRSRRKLGYIKKTKDNGYYRRPS